MQSVNLKACSTGTQRDRASLRTFKYESNKKRGFSFNGQLKWLFQSLNKV